MNAPSMKKRHSFTVKGYIERGSPYISWEISFIEADSIEEAISQVHGMFKEPVMISDVRRIISRERGYKEVTE